MNWIRGDSNGKTSTHYYLGLESLCQTERLDLLNSTSYTSHSMYGEVCTICKKIVKAKSIQEKISEIKERQYTVETECLEKYGITIRDMALNAISAEGEIGIVDLEKLIRTEYPDANSGEIIQQVIISGKAKLENDTVVISEVHIA